jgi:two-component sensor histidine kinase
MALICRQLLVFIIFFPKPVENQLQLEAKGLYEGNFAMLAPNVIPLHPAVAVQPATEADHRIANHLALIVSAVEVKRRTVEKGPAMVSKAEVSAYLRSISGIVVSTAELHRTLARQPDDRKFDLGPFVWRICSLFLSSLEMNGRATLNEVLDVDCFVSAGQAHTIGLLVTEVLTNAIKHAHPTGLPVAINLACRRGQGQNLVVEISDDGIGLPENFDPITSGGVGFKLIRSLSDSLGASMTVDSDSLGTTFRFEFEADPNVQA